MQTSSPFPVLPAQKIAADATIPAAAATDVELLALALLRAGQTCEIEAGLEVHITPPLAPSALAALAGIGDYSAGLLLAYLVEAGFLARRRERFILANPEALYRLALGAPPV